MNNQPSTENTETFTAILVGRHTPDGLPDGIQIVGQENILWSLDSEEIRTQMTDLIAKAEEAGAKILLQNIPGVLAPVLAEVSPQHPGLIGVIVSQPGPRKPDEVITRVYSTEAEAAAAYGILIETNGRSQPELRGTDVTYRHSYAPAFEFVRVEWITPDAKPEPTLHSTHQMADVHAAQAAAEAINRVSPTAKAWADIHGVVHYYA